MVKFRPKDDRSWDLLECTLLESGRPGVDDVPLKRWQANPTVHNRYLYAKALARKKETALAERDLREALKMDPSDIYCRLGLAALILRKNADPANLEEVRKYLSDADQAAILPEEHAMLEALEVALGGDLRRSALLFACILVSSPENETAKKALKILSGWPPK